MSAGLESRDEYAREKTRRVMSRVALKKMSVLAVRFRAEEAEDAVLAKRILLAIVGAVALWSVAVFAAVSWWPVSISNPTVQFCACSLLVGLLAVAVPVAARPTRGK